VTQRIALRRRARRRGLAAAASVAIVIASVAGAIGLLPGADSTARVTTEPVVSDSQSWTADPITSAEGSSPQAATEPRLTLDLPHNTTAPSVAWPEVPADSGAGKRIVFDQSAQRVWLVDEDEAVIRTYLGSGSRTDILQPGHYEVFSRSRHAVSFNYRDTMAYMVRFAHGERSAIGFHSIPVDSQGRPVQTRDQLGVPRSAGCIRQARPDARALWRFAPIGTDVWVVA